MTRPPTSWLAVTLAVAATSCVKSYVWIDATEVSTDDAATPDVPVADASDIIDVILVDAPDAAGPPRPRLIYPMSTARQTGDFHAVVRSPSVAVDKIVVDLCSTRACAAADVIGHAESSLNVAADSDVALAVPSATLPPASSVVWWRAAAVTNTVRGAYTDVWEVVRIRRTAGHSTVVGHVLDIDADGHPEMIAGAPGSTVSGAAGAGRAAVLEYDTSLRTFSATYLDHTTAGELYGFAVAAAGDLNGDGFGDIAVSTDPANHVSDIFVYYGSSTRMLTAARAPIHTPNAGTNFAEQMAGIGDFDGDGYGDLAVSASYANTVYVYFGSSNGLNAGAPLIINPPATTAIDFGSSLAALGEITEGNPHRTSFVTGAPSSGAHDGGGAPGRAFIVMGTNTTSPNLQILTPVGAGSAFGASVAGGDVDGDGLPDVAVGSYGSPATILFNDTGAITTLGELSIPGAGSSTSYGAAVAILESDASSAATSNIAIGDPSGSAMVGAVSVVAMSRRVPGSTMTLVPMNSGMLAPHRFGTALANAGDIDRDGVSDLAIGAPADGTAMSGPSAAFLYVGGTLAVFQPGSATANELGFSIAMRDVSRGDLVALWASSPPTALF